MQQAGLPGWLLLSWEGDPTILGKKSQQRVGGFLTAHYIGARSGINEVSACHSLPASLHTQPNCCVCVQESMVSSSFSWREMQVPSPGQVIHWAVCANLCRGRLPEEAEQVFHREGYRQRARLAGRHTPHVCLPGSYRHTTTNSRYREVMVRKASTSRSILSGAKE